MRLLIAIILLSIWACQTKKDETNSSPLDSTTAVVQTDTIKKSIKKEERFQVGAASITIQYHSPGVKGRIIWGGLVPMDQVWVTGAHMATSFEIDKDFEVGGTTIVAGKYALFTIPGKDEWKFIINKNWEQHLTDEYDAKDDVVRIAVQPEYNQPHQERLSYAILTEGDKKANLAISWEKIRIVIPITIK